MTIAVIDGIGGGIGAQIVERLRREGIRDASILALGANAVATQRMVDAGADKGASGENAIRISVASADYVLGPIGIALPNAMMGEITPGIAEAVFAAREEAAPPAQPAARAHRRHGAEKRERAHLRRHRRLEEIDFGIGLRRRPTDVLVCPRSA